MGTEPSSRSEDLRIPVIQRFPGDVTYYTYANPNSSLAATPFDPVDSKGSDKTTNITVAPLTINHLTATDPLQEVFESSDSACYHALIERTTQKTAPAAQLFRSLRHSE